MIDSKYKELYAKALNARDNAYAPYSKFKVGACVLMKDGAMFDGCNIENASFGATNCAERTAIFKAVSNGYEYGDFDKLLVLGDTKGLCYPCAICRQVMSEFFEKTSEIIVCNIKGDYKVYRFEELLPFAFDKGELD